MRTDSRRHSKQPALKLTEADLERQCSDILALDGWRTLKTDPVSRREWGKGFGEKGMADRLYIRYLYVSIHPYVKYRENLSRYSAEVLWIEWKSQRGRVKPHQSAWNIAERRRGAAAFIAGVDFPATFEGFCAWYAESGLMRRAGLCSISSKDATNAPRAE